MSIAILGKHVLTVVFDLFSSIKRTYISVGVN